MLATVEGSLLTIGAVFSMVVSWLLTAVKAAESISVVFTRAAGRPPLLLTTDFAFARTDPESQGRTLCSLSSLRDESEDIVLG